ncbi:MAG: hypothetical protein A3A43_01185 [Candidatus Liptonbacteria bacterium RIFCSPLOWO2_01_FULL_56_20]|uniref:UDP-N-acetylmuramyl-tripeptide synthetase n=1 Tax=Candidatus Liptonbacteria bacterium RIFCSPLOWO2_01_FULL_56_20 TaxID=1798652 RepID=A0A1G2CLT6_9BACT|nr:MAG: hypothetical protein A3A43_01185 [Candidatus Liptonbacteria bacterium RIFCSPLOWO2_01_FULL_56_20]
MLLHRIKSSPFGKLFYSIPWAGYAYHFTLSFLSALRYGFPSRRLVTIGVTGTKGKTTTCNLIAQIFEAAGERVGMITTVNFKIGEREWVNDLKQTMPGRFALQKLLREMVSAGCKYAVVETSSEGILQYRHRFIDYRVAVFTNLSPEHIERHGSFERYRAAKVKLFEQVARRRGVGVYNLDDPNVGYFLAPKMSEQYGYALKAPASNPALQTNAQFRVSGVQLATAKTKFMFDRAPFAMPLVGEFNVYNAASAICVAHSQGIPMGTIRRALAHARPTPGRFEVVDKGQGFTVVVDYAHEPASLDAAYKTLKLFRPKKIIGVLGAQGGGRDKWKRAEMGKIAARYCDTLILTNEDPYDENPMNIVVDIEKGVRGSGRDVEALKIIDRGEAIQKAVARAGRGDAVIITGKGGEVWMCVAGGRKISWSDREATEEALSMRRQKIKKAASAPQS